MQNRKTSTPAHPNCLERSANETASAWASALGTASPGRPLREYLVPKKAHELDLASKVEFVGLFGNECKKKKKILFKFFIKKNRKAAFLENFSFWSHVANSLFSSLRMFRSGWMGHDYCAACFVFGCVLITTFLFSFFFICKFD